MGWASESVGRLIARYLAKPESGYEPFTPSEADSLRALLQPGDVILVEGNNHISGVIKYLTQSTWSHAALYVGPVGDRCAENGEPLVLVEANIDQGVVAVPVPQRWRRRMMALGSGHPTRIICSALIAQAFEQVRYPILPTVTQLESEAAREEILEIRHSSLYAPRDFDISPYFEVVKPTIERGFDYKTMSWADTVKIARAELAKELPAPAPAEKPAVAA